MKQTRGVLIRKFGLTVMYGVLFVIFFLGMYVLATRVFAIREITVVGGNIQVQIDQKRLPKTLLFFPSDKMRTEILLANPILADIRFEKRYPYTLLIVPILRSPAALLITPSRRVFVDARGIVLADADTSGPGLPQIFASISGLRIGQLVSDKRVTSGLAFLSGIQSTMQIETIMISDDGVIQAHTGNLDILFTQKEETFSILTTLQTLIMGFRIKGTLPTVIDLRFDKPVVKF